MKKDQRRQERRRRALDRFSIKSSPPDVDPTQRAKYLERKEIEFAALKHALGTNI